MEALEFTLNGKQEQATVAPTVTLLEYLRMRGSVGTKEGCAEGDCGACTVAVVAQNAAGERVYKAMNSCLIPLGSVSGQEVVTVEGLARGEALHPVQSALVATGGSQCGYCTPGFIMSLFAGYYGGDVSDHSLEGNLCRCTGYLPIRRAAAGLTPPPTNDPFLERLGKTGGEARDYSHPQGKFFVPRSLEEVVVLLEQHPEARLIAGGTDLGVDINKFHVHYPLLVSVEHVPELKRLEVTPASVTIGAGVVLSHLQTELRGIFPALDEMLSWFASRQIRNRATLGGNLGTASPIGDLPPVLLALDAEVTLYGTQGERTVGISSYFQAYRQTERQPNEVIVSVRVARALPAGAVTRLSQSYKVGKRGADDISIVAAAFTVDLDAQERVVSARLAYGGVAAIPIRALEAEALLIGKAWDYETVREVRDALYTAFTPLSDLRGSAAYRNKLIGNLFQKFFIEMRQEVTV